MRHRFVLRACQVLVADPPWRFKDKLPGKGRGARKHYPTMGTGAICGFPLPTLAESALLFLWRVASMPDDALAVCRAWGFVPKSEIVWVKTLDGEPTRLRIGMGRYVRNSHETCLIGARGSARHLIANHSIPSVFTAPRGRHSEKPERFYQIVEALVGPDVEKVELFARRARRGWETYGDEIGRPHPGFALIP